MAYKTREELRFYFRPNEVPLSSDFLNLIQTLIANYVDGIQKDKDTPLSISAGNATNAPSIQLFPHQSSYQTPPANGQGSSRGTYGEPVTDWPTSTPDWLFELQSPGAKAGLSMREPDASNPALFIDKTTSRVGINEDTPLVQLHINGDAMLPNTALWLRNAYNNNVDPNHALQYKPFPIDGPMLWGHSGGALGYTNGKPSVVAPEVKTTMRWDNQGQVGIGLGNEDINNTLHLRGNMTIDHEPATLWKGTKASDIQLNLGNPGFGIGSGSYSDADPGNFDATVLWSSNEANRGILFASTNDVTQPFSGIQHNVFIAGNSGNVGLGTTTPNAKLSFGTKLSDQLIGLWDDPQNFYGFGIQNNQMKLAVGNSTARFSFLAATDELVTIQGSGNVGIGNTNPIAKLEMGGDIAMDNHTIYLRGELNSDGVPDPNHGLRFDGTTDGAHLWGTKGGVLGYTNILPSLASPTIKHALRWDEEGNIGLGAKSNGSHLAFVQTFNDKQLGLWDDPGNWYGLGMQDNQLKITMGSATGRTSFMQNGTELFTVTGSGQVGIQNPTPIAALDVKGKAVMNDNSIYFRVPLSGIVDQNHGIGFHNSVNGPLLWGYSGGALGYTAGQPNQNTPEQKIALRWNDTGNVGIGTETPNSKLSFGQILDKQLLALWDNPGDFYGFGIQNDQLLLSVGNSGSRFTFTTGDTPLLTVLGNGNVGIANTEPTQRLDVVGNATIHAQNIWQDNQDSNSRIYLSDANFGVGSGMYSGDAGDGATVIWSYNGAGRGTLFASTGSGSTESFSQMNHLMFLAGDSGNLGIGTLTPNSKLSFGQNLDSKLIALWDDPTDFFGFGLQENQLRIAIGNTASRFSFMAKSKELLTISGTGKVGIGTTEPTAPLHVVGNGLLAVQQPWMDSRTHNARLNLTDSNHGVGSGSYDTTDNNGNNATFVWSGNTAGDGILFASTPNGDTGKLSGMNQNVFIAGDTGNVGIGTLTPNSRLSFGTALNKQLLGLYEDGSTFYGFGIQADELQVRVGDATSRISFLTGDTAFTTLLANGNLGLGQTNPMAKLDMGGDILMRDHRVYFRNLIDDAPDQNHGIGFQNDLNGPCLWGYAGGALGYTAGQPGVAAPEVKLSMRWDTNGNVGIGTGLDELHSRLSLGTTDSNALLGLKDDPANFFGFGMVSNSLLARIGNTGSNKFAIDYNGNQVFEVNSEGKVGIGVSAPNATLSLGKTFNDRAIGLWDDTSSFYGFGIQAGQLKINVGDSTGRLSVMQDATELLSVSGTGNVGIGLTDQNHSLAVAGSVRLQTGAIDVDGALLFKAGTETAGTISFQDGSGSNLLEIDGSNKTVAIGPENATDYELTVNGGLTADSITAPVLQDPTATAYKQQPASLSRNAEQRIDRSLTGDMLALADATDQQDTTPIDSTQRQMIVAGLKGIDVSYYKWQDTAMASGLNDAQPRLGLTADQVQPILPTLVKTLDSKKGIDVMQLASALLVAYNDLDDRYNALLTEVNDLKNQVTSPPPSSNTWSINAEPPDGSAPHTVQFTLAATNLVALEWDFGDGNTSTEQNPVHVYDQSGVFAPHVTMHFADQSVHTDGAGEIHVDAVPPPPPAPIHQIDPVANPTEGPAPLEVQFNAGTSSDAISWAWDFKDGNTSTEENPVHTYATPDTYQPSLVVTYQDGNTNTAIMAAIDVVNP